MDGACLVITKSTSDGHNLSNPKFIRLLYVRLHMWSSKIISPVQCYRNILSGRAGKKRRISHQQGVPVSNPNLFVIVLVYIFPLMICGITT